MAKPSTHPPRLDAPRSLDLAEGDTDSLESHDGRDGERYSGADLGERDLAGATFSECEFLDLSAHETDFRAAEFVDTRFDRLNAPIFTAPRSRFRDVTIENSRVGSAEFYEASWQSVHFRNCKLGYINLRGANLRDVLFTNCQIEELDLGGAKALRVAFVDTVITNLDVTRSQLEHVDLRGADMRALSGLEGLRGATVNPYQVTELAPIFARQFGIRVEE